MSTTPNETRPTSGIEIRWMQRGDVEHVLRVEKACYEKPWTRENLLHALVECETISFVAVRFGELVGFIVYELFQAHYDILNVAVLPELQRYGIGTMFINDLKRRMKKSQRKILHALVRETNLPGQLFFKANQFRAIGTVKNHFGEEDHGYRFLYESVHADNGNIRTEDREWVA